MRGYLRARLRDSSGVDHGDTVHCFEAEKVRPLTHSLEAIEAARPSPLRAPSSTMIDRHLPSPIGGMGLVRLIVGLKDLQY